MRLGGGRHPPQVVCYLNRTTASFALDYRCVPREQASPRDSLRVPLGQGTHYIIPIKREADRVLRPRGGVDDGLSAPESEADASREFALGGVALGCACLRVGCAGLLASLFNGCAGLGAEASQVARAHDAAVRSSRARPIL